MPGMATERVASRTRRGLCTGLLGIADWGGASSSRIAVAGRGCREAAGAY